MKDYYKMLAVPPDAPATRVRQAYRELVKAGRPDDHPSETSAEWAAGLQEAHAILSDPEARASYDMDLKLAASKRGETAGKQAGAGQSWEEIRPSPETEPNYCCEKCRCVDSSLRISAIWRVASGIIVSRKSAMVRILCGRCRRKESLAANARTALLGWWGVPGFLWTIRALATNATGGRQPAENNSLLLRAVSHQLYQRGNIWEAYLAYKTAVMFKHDPDADLILAELEREARPPESESLWPKIHIPAFLYYVAVIAAGMVLAVLGFHALKNGPKNAESQTQAELPPLPQKDSSPSAPDAKTPPQVLAAAEQPVPGQGALMLGPYFVTNNAATAPLKITAPTSGDYLVKVEDWSTKEVMALYYIKRGGTLSIEMPAGSYRLKFASGDKWHGVKNRFGPGTAYSYFPGRMDFNASGGSPRGHDIVLGSGISPEMPPMKAEDW